ncbi:MAG TPA: hypothetical protein VLH19_01005 [Patescibacteria group bacterium]|nr:hypothetical protein [Patescibacteria group bacterium]
MTTSRIYERYTIPPNLIRHQLEVTAVGRWVCDHWVGQDINEELITQALLLHDMGNIIKFKRPFLGELEKDHTHWENVQEEFIATYGNDVHTATDAIVNELGLPEVFDLLQQMEAVWKDPEHEQSWDAKICEYADCCVTPEGIVGFEIRIADLKNRYDMTDTSQHVILATKNAREVEENYKGDLLQEDWQPLLSRLSTFDLISSPNIGEEE